MARHVFLTGERQVGKSTLLRKVMECCGGKTAGFCTTKTTGFLPDKMTVHLQKPGEEPVFTEQNLLFVCRTREKKTADVFDQTVARTLEIGEDTGLIIMDELGPHETEAVIFWEAVTRALDGDVPVLGVLQKADSPTLKRIADHPKVTVIPVTEKNRDEKMLLQKIIEILRKEGDRNE